MMEMTTNGKEDGSAGLAFFPGRKFMGRGAIAVVTPEVLTDRREWDGVSDLTPEYRGGNIATGA